MNQHHFLNALAALLLLGPLAATGQIVHYGSDGSMNQSSSSGNVVTYAGGGQPVVGQPVVGVVEPMIVNPPHVHVHPPVQPGAIIAPHQTMDGGIPLNSFPVIITPNRVNGVNPFTGGIDTSNMQINNSVFDVGRDASRNNGTARRVVRPVYDVSGRVIGQQEGVEWFNPLTGRWHGEMQNSTLNSHGGVHTGNVFYGAIPR